MAPKNFYITTPIYYVNDVPHLGHTYTTVAADAMARYKRLCGYSVIFLTGTDEHGQKAHQAAEKRNIPVQAHVDELHLRFKDLWKRLNISNTDFIRTTEPRHTKVVQDALDRLHRKGEIYLAEYEGWYCVPDERFWVERDLVDGNCPLCGRKVEMIRESNYFFRMGKYREWLVDYIRSHESFILPEIRRNEVLGFLEKSLGDLCISRPKDRFSWGVPIPFDDRYVTYVWFDALLNYISSLQSYGEGYLQAYWPADLHLIGKDILTTHSVYWSTMLRAMELPLPKSIFAHGWWTVNGRKMSKSFGNVVDPNQLVEHLGVDPVRYFILREVPFGLDGNFSYSGLIGRINSDLANNLGNLCSRLLNMVHRYKGGVIPKPEGAETEADRELKSAVERTHRGYRVEMDQLGFSKALALLLELSDAVNRYIVTEQPWELAKHGERSGRLGTVLYTCSEAVRTLGLLLYPFLPESGAAIWRGLGIEESVESAGDMEEYRWGRLNPGGSIPPVETLFPRIDEKKSDEIHRALGFLQEKTEGEAEESRGLTIEEFQNVDLRSGKIVKAERIPKSKKLLKLGVEIGSETRQLVAGIAESYKPEDLIGRTVVVVANLKPTKIMGVESQGMVLAANAGDRLVLTGFQETVESGVKVR